MASEPLQYNPLFPTSIWCHEIWVASTNCETCGNLEERAERAQRIVTRYNSHDALVAALKKISNGPWSQSGTVLWQSLTPLSSWPGNWRKRNDKV